MKIKKKPTTTKPRQTNIKKSLDGNKLEIAKEAEFDKQRKLPKQN